MIGCPRCGSRVVFLEVQYIGRGTRLLQWCGMRRCGHWWFDDKAPKQWKTLAIIKGRALCLVEGLERKLLIGGRDRDR